MKLKIISRHGVDDRRVLPSEFDAVCGLEGKIFILIFSLFVFGMEFVKTKSVKS